MPYIRPEQVTAPQNHWQLNNVLYDGGADGWSAAEGLWDGERALALRWNGNDNQEKGNPISSGHPTWFIVPEELEGVMSAVLEFSTAFGGRRQRST